MLVGRIALLTGMLVVALSLAAPASGQTVSCGQVLTADTKIENDLVGCPGNGLVIGADHITLDLNGHTIAGRFEAYDCSASCLGKNGIDNSAGHDRVVIEHGTIRSFDHGLHLAGTRRSVITGLTVVASSPSATTRASRLTAGSWHDRIRDTTISGEDPGILLSGSDRNQIGDTTVSGSISQHEGDGVQVLDGSAANVLVHNNVEADGIALVVRGSRRNLIVGNTLETGLSYWCRRSPPPTETRYSGTPSPPTARSGASAWTATGTSSGGPPLPSEPGGSRCRAHGMLFAAAAWTAPGVQGDGIAVLAGAGTTLVDRNLVTGAGDDGIDADAPGNAHPAERGQQQRRPRHRGRPRRHRPWRQPGHGQRNPAPSASTCSAGRVGRCELFVRRPSSGPWPCACRGAPLGLPARPATSPAPGRRSTAKRSATPGGTTDYWVRYGNHQCPRV